MKKAVKKIMALALSVAMMVTMISVPVFADTQTGLATGVYYQNDFNTLAAGGKWDAMAFPASSVTAPDGAWGSEIIYASLSGSAASSSLPGDDRDAQETIVRNSTAGDNAFKLGTSKATAAAETVGAKLYPNGLSFTRGENKVLHVKFDMMVEDKLTKKTFSMRRASDKNSTEVVRFDPGPNRIYVWEDYYLKEYSAGEWYNFDMYLDFDGKMAYICTDGKYIRKTVDGYYSYNLESEAIDILQFATATSTSAPVGMGVDNLLVEVLDKANVPVIANAAKPAAYFHEHYSATYDMGKDDNGNERNPAVGLESNAGASAEKIGSVFGKSQTDKVLHVYNNQSGLGVGGWARRIDCYPGNAGISLQEGDIFHYSTMLALDDNSLDPKVILFYSPSRFEALTIAADGSWVQAAGKQLPDVKVKKNQWYRFDFVVTIGASASMDVYVNGVEKASDLAVNATSMDEILTGYYVQAGNDGYYADDVTLIEYSNAASVISPAVSLTNEAVNVNLDMIDNVSADYTVAQFKADTVANVNYEVRDANGCPVADEALLAGNNVVLMPAVGGDIYLPVRAQGYTIFESNYDDVQGALALTGAASSIEAGVAGNPTNANILTVDNSGSATLVSTERVNFEGTQITFEATVMAPKGTDASARFYIQETAADKREAITFKADGNIFYGRTNDNSSKDTGIDWVPGQWYHITAVATATNGTVYLNGKSVGTMSIFANNKASIQGFGLDVMGAGAVSGIDNIKVYDGGYNAAKDAVTLTTLDNSLLVDNEKREIYIIDDQYDSPLSWYFAEDTVIYEDATLETEYDVAGDSINEDLVVVAVSESGSNFGYYTIKHMSEAEIFVVKQGDAYVTSDGISAEEALHVEAYGDISAQLLVAQYCDGELIALAEGVDGVADSVAIEATADRVVLMYFNNMTDITPLKVAKEFSIAR